MQITVILAFAVLFWRAEANSSWLLISRDEIGWTLLLVLGFPCLAGLASWLATRRVRRMLALRPSAPERAQRFHHRVMAGLRVFTLLAFGASVLVTPWPDWVSLQEIHPALQIAADWLVLMPFFASLLLLWLGTYSADGALRTAGGPGMVLEEPNWGLRRYLDFNLRHQLLTVAVPMSLILMAANLVRAYRPWIENQTGLTWAPDGILGGVALVVFLITPLLLRHIWRTRSLDRGPLRERLEALCGRIGLRVRDILVWDSGGLMVNAAVMGVFPCVRYVLLSDALLSTMSPRQIEAVFGHEAGHVRHKHIQHLLVFAFVGWLIVAGIIEVLSRGIGAKSPADDGVIWSVQGIGIVATVVFWGIGFGWVSRRFERQADLFGASCVTPSAAECVVPCSVHGELGSAPASENSICATAAGIFASALDRVAVLNGIPPDERSWRHSSIGSRIRFLIRLAGDPKEAVRFQEAIRSWKSVMLVLAVVGSLVSVIYGLFWYGR